MRAGRTNWLVTLCCGLAVSCGVVFIVARLFFGSPISDDFQCAKIVHLEDSFKALADERNQLIKSKYIEGETLKSQWHKEKWHLKMELKNCSEHGDGLLSKSLSQDKYINQLTTKLNNVYVTMERTNQVLTATLGALKAAELVINKMKTKQKNSDSPIISGP